MTLVPVIYTSLLIFSAFLFIVISISYVSYKLKSKNTPSIASSYSNPQPMFVPVKSIIQNKRENIPAHSHISIKSIDQKEKERQLKNREESKILRKEVAPLRERPIQLEIVNKHSDMGNNRDYNRSTKRIEIMNTTKMFTKNGNSFNSSTTKKVANLNNYNILDNYYDRNDSQFVTLTTKVI